ncbi:actin-bundling T4SS effector WalE1 family protein [Wolbachia endosymbiont of Drosophila barbarae]|uniref:actin-bundling T4SS effector WalE1 family protein n=1 Tax=Wolbachia endosymbiont of Drosophila barbarae TaxID=3377043 RepID=UPI0038003E5C
MSPNEKNSVVTEQGNDLGLNKTTQDSLNLEAAKDSKKLKERITDLLKGDTEFSKMKQGDKILVVSAASGLFTAVLPLLAVGATLAIPGAIVGLALYFAVKVAVKTVQSGYKGLKWSAEKTVDGAKYTAGKVKDTSVYTAEKAREGYYSVKGAISSVGRATRERTGATLGKMGRSLSNLSKSMSSLDAIPYSIDNEGQTVVLKTEEKTRNFNSVKEMVIKEVLEDKAVNSFALTKEIFSKLGEKILEKAYSVDGQSGFQKDQLINQLKQQADFVNKLYAKKLQSLLSKDNNSLYEIFSDHHDEIKRIVKECKIEHKLSNSIENLNEVAGKYGIRKGSMQSFENSSSRSSSMSFLNSVSTDSTISSEAELLNPANHKEVKTATSLLDKVSSPFKSGKKSEKTSEVKYQVLSESDTLPRKIGNSTFYVDTPTPIENTNKTATIGGRPGVARRNSTSNLTRVETPEVPTRSASLTNLNGQSSFSEDVLSDPKVNQYLGNSNKGTLTRSNSFDSARGSSGPSTPTSSLERLEQSFSKDEVGAAMEKNLKEFSLSAKTESTLHNSFSNRNGSDSGFNSPTSSPTHTMFTENGKAKTQADLRKTGHLDKLVGQPSTKVAVDTDVQQQAAQTAVKTN